MSTIAQNVYDAYDSTADRDDQVIAIKKAANVSLSKATKLRMTIAKERGDASGRTNIIDSMYEFLAEKARTEAEFKKWIEDNGTENTMRWFKQHDKARELANRLHEKAAEAAKPSRRKAS